MASKQIPVKIKKDFFSKRNLDKQYLDQLKDFPYDPVFVLGFHRSGTSILYKMIQSTGEFNSVTTYHVMQYDRLLYNHLQGVEELAKEKLNNFLLEHNDIDRGIDRLKMEADLPLEYAFLIDDGYVFNKLTSHNLDRFKEIYKKIQFIGENDKKFLAKNPWDFANFMFIKKHFPNAKFIFIHRHPYPFLNSSLKALRTLTKQQTVYSDLISPTAKHLSENPLINGIFRFLLSRQFPFALPLIVEHHALQARYFLDNVKKLDDESYVNVKYEDLCSKPNETMKKIMDLLDVNKNNNHFEKFIKPRNLTISQDIEKVQDYIYKRMKSYFSYFKYPSYIS